jgi:hypothetical protein
MASKEHPMITTLDLVLAVSGVAFFLLSIAYAYACDHL